MNTAKTKSTFSIIGLFLISIIWGLSFVFMKDAITQASVLYVLAIRFLLAGIPLALIFFKRLLKANKKDFLRGLIVGLILVVSYVFQGYGCKYTTASKTALLSSVYGVLVPFSSWLIFKKKPKLASLIFAVIAFVGIGLITINGFDKINIGDILTLFGGVAFAFQISLLSEFTKKTDPILLTTIQFLVIGFVLICFAPIEGDFPTYLFTDTSLLWRMLVLAFLCTMLCFLLQSICQKNVHVVASGVIISLEATFGVIAGVLMNHDPFTNLMIVGIVILFISVFGLQVYEPVVDRIKKRKSRVEITSVGNNLGDIDKDDRNACINDEVDESESSETTQTENGDASD